ncbi:heparinase II/III family protein [Niabella ginsengisoli]
MQSNYHNLPLINGVAQSDGSMYKAQHVSFNASKSRFSAGISAAYKKDAAIKIWQRTYTLSAKGLVIEDEFELSKIISPSVINFLTWANPDISKPGIVELIRDGRKVTLAYNKNVFEARIETIPLEDKRLSNVWGNEIYRLSLVAKKQALKDKYQFIIK